jgi:hypothetical protein
MHAINERRTFAIQLTGFWKQESNNVWIDIEKT